MPLAATLEKLYLRKRFRIHPGTDRIQNLLDRLGNPERKFRTIHIVGTNGKGSTAAFLSSILTAAGYRTGRFTSPHLLRFNERFSIDGKEPQDCRVEALLEQTLKAASEETTFFEIITALAALLFFEEGIEIAIMEAGMGGRSDATAVLPGMMTLVTPISLDHCEYLGDTLEQIATEKVSIAEPGTPVICAKQNQSVLNVVRAFSNCGESETYFSGMDFNATWKTQDILEYVGINDGLFHCKPGVPGRYQMENAALAMAAAETMNKLGTPVPNDSLPVGISAACWPGRMELINEIPRLLLDGAHNPSGAAALCEELNSIHYERLLLVIGAMSDKDIAAMLSPLASHAAQCFCVAPAIERAMSDTQLANMLSGMGFSSKPCGNVANGIKAARNEAGPDDLILVTGSLFVVGETKALLTGNPFRGIRG